MGWADIGRQGGIQRRMSVWYNRRSVMWAGKVIIQMEPSETEVILQQSERRSEDTVWIVC